MTTANGLDIAPWIERLVSSLKNEAHSSLRLSSPVVEQAFRRVPRHLFVETFYVFAQDKPERVMIEHDPQVPRPDHLDIIYSDVALITRNRPPFSSTSQPSLMATMLQILALMPGMKVLEIGAGTGYNAALMAELVGDQRAVISVDIQADIIAQSQRLLADAGYADIRVLAQDGFDGVIDEAPFDRIVATAACPDLSPHWVAQLSANGFMLIPLLYGSVNILTKVWQEEGILKGEILSSCSFIPMEGALNTGPASMGMLFPPGEEDVEALPPFDSFEPSLFYHFYFFVVLRDPRAYWTFQPDGCGLADESQGRIAINRQTGGVLLKGDRTLYDELQALYLDWLALGKPQWSQYNLEFLREPPPPSTMPKSTSVVKRPFYWHRFTLPDEPFG